MPDLDLETRAIRMLHAGDPAKLVAQTTGLPVADVQRLQRDFPGPRRAPAQRPAADTGAATNACEHILELPLHVLTAHPANVRSDLGNDAELQDLAQSIRAHGLLQPLAIMRRDRQYLILAGHRRLAACVIAGVDRVPVTFQPTKDDAGSIEAMLVENLQRAALDPIDEAQAYQRLMSTGRTTTQIARSLGVNVGTISARLVLLNLTPAEQQAVRNKEISVHAAYLAGRDRSTRRRPHDTKRPKPKTVPHFNRKHPLADVVATSCGHDTLLKLGPGCGPCWEAAIRADATRAVVSDEPIEDRHDPVPAGGDE